MRGIDTHRKRYDMGAVVALKAIIGIIRPSIEIFECTDTDECMEAGIRFNDDDNIIARIESRASQNIALNYAEDLVAEALRDAARADYYYKYEKEW